MKKDDLEWRQVCSESYLLLAPIEYISRWALFLYHHYAMVKILIATTGVIALWLTLLQLTDRTEDRKLQSLMYFNDIKSDSGSTSVVALLKRLIDKNILIEEIPTSGANLNKLNFDDFELVKANLSNSKIMNSSFKKTTFHEVDFSESFLNSANFENAHFNLTNFSNSKLAYSNFKSSKGENTDFTQAFMFDADFSDSEYIKGRFTLVQGSRINFKNANLENSNFWKGKVSEADFSGANLKDADFGGAELGRAKFIGADISGAKFESLVGDDVDVAIVTPAQLILACVTGVQPVLPSSEEFKELNIPKCL